MHWKEIEQNWKEFERMFNHRWNLLTKDDLRQINGKQALLNAKLKEHYGMNQAEADGQINTFLNTFQGVVKGITTVSQKQD